MVVSILFGERGEIDICPLEKRERGRVSRRQEQMVGELVNTEARVKVRRGTGWIKTRVLGYGGGYAGVVRPPVASNVDELYP